MSILTKIFSLFFYVLIFDALFLSGIALLVDAARLHDTNINLIIVCGSTVIFQVWGFFEYRKTITPLNNEINEKLYNFIIKRYGERS